MRIVAIAFALVLTPIVASVGNARSSLLAKICDGHAPRRDATPWLPSNGTVRKAATGVDSRSWGAPPSAAIADVAWLAGRWVGQRFGHHQVELVFSPPAGKAMVGHLVDVSSDGAQHYEMVQIREEEGSIVFCAKRFSENLTAETLDEARCALLSGVGRDEWHFQTQSFQRVGGAKFVQRVQYIKAEDGTVQEEMITYQRPCF